MPDEPRPGWIVEDPSDRPLIIAMPSLQVVPPASAAKYVVPGSTGEAVGRSAPAQMVVALRPDRRL
jgi:hypothetical protein